MSHQEPVTLRSFAEKIGVKESTLRRWCIAGKIIGARKHHLTKKWVIYPPAKLVTDGCARDLTAMPGYQRHVPRASTAEERAESRARFNPDSVFKPELAKFKGGSHD